MKIFGWMQNKLNGKSHGSKKPNTISVNYHDPPRKEEFDDWPDGLLAIGTLGNQIKERSKHNLLHENPPSSAKENHQQQLITPEEVRKLQNELDSLLQKQDGSSYDTMSIHDTKLALDKFLASQGNGSTNDNTCSDGSNSKDCCTQSSASVVLSRGKDLCVDNASGAINKITLSFLLKKIFVCNGGFSTPRPSSKDQVPESRMEKLLRAILQKKIYPQNPSPTLSTKKYLENKHNKKMGSNSNKDEEKEKGQDDDNGSKWVKTDSEYIVLEI